MQTHTDSFTYEGTTYYLSWIPGDSHEGLEPITQAYGFCFDEKGQLLVIHSSGLDAWQIPGGTPEEGETPEETLIREVEEESNTEIKNIHYIGAQKVVEDNGKTYYQLRYAAEVDRLNDRKIDPDKKYIIPRKFIDPKDFRVESKWGEIADLMVERSMEVLGIKND